MRARRTSLYTHAQRSVQLAFPPLFGHVCTLKNEEKFSYVSHILAPRPPPPPENNQVNVIINPHLPLFMTFPLSAGSLVGRGTVDCRLLDTSNTATTVRWTNQINLKLMVSA